MMNLDSGSGVVGAGRSLAGGVEKYFVCLLFFNG